MKPSEYKNIILQALKEDAAESDITTNILFDNKRKSTGYIIAKENAIVCGLDMAKAVFRKLDKNVRFHNVHKDGNSIKKGERLLEIHGKTRALLTGERTALNFLGYLSGIATNTNNYVKKIHPYKTRILDTRKTTPGMRKLEKYAVKCGKGTNHRINLVELVMIKDNHREISKNFPCLSDAIHFFKKKTHKQIEIEVDTLSQLKQALRADPDIILLDNMSPATLRKAIKMVKSTKKGKKNPLLEASGGVTLKNIKAIAATGVDMISIGALTHTHRFINLSMEIIS